MHSNNIFVVFDIFCVELKLIFLKSETGSYHFKMPTGQCFRLSLKSFTVLIDETVENVTKIELEKKLCKKILVKFGVSVTIFSHKTAIISINNSSEQRFYSLLTVFNVLIYEIF